MKILILGHSGMLGSMAKKYFENNGHQIETITDRYNFEKRQDFSNAVRNSDSDVVLNCIGLIKQKSNEIKKLYELNSMLPSDLALVLREDQFLVHPSTDCVFNGLADRPYTHSDFPDANDVYGVSKYVGERAVLSRANTLVIRTSIIGPEHEDRHAQGLLGWFLSQSSNSTISGYNDHYWNGITTLEWCIQVESFLQNRASDPIAFVQLGTKHVCTKYELLNLFNLTYDKSVTINNVSSGKKVFRALEPTLVCKSIESQLIELEAMG